jgi:hypothetical protein
LAPAVADSSVCVYPAFSHPAAAGDRAAFEAILGTSAAAVSDDPKPPLPQITDLADADNEPDGDDSDPRPVAAGDDVAWNPQCGVSFVATVMSLEAALASAAADISAGRPLPQVPPARCSEEWKQMAIEVACRAGLVPATDNIPVRAAFQIRPSVGLHFVLRAPTAEEGGAAASSEGGSE